MKLDPCRSRTDEEGTAPQPAKKPRRSSDDAARRGRGRPSSESRKDKVRQRRLIDLKLVEELVAFFELFRCDVGGTGSFRYFVKLRAALRQGN